MDHVNTHHKATQYMVRIIQLSNKGILIRLSVHMGLSHSAGNGTFTVERQQVKEWGPD